MAYPNLKQSIWLVVIMVFIDIVLGSALAFMDVTLGQTPRLIDYVIWISCLPVFALLVLYAKRRSGRPWSDILLFRTVPWKMYLPLTVSIVGLAIIIFNLANFIQYLIPIPERILDIFRNLMGRETPYAFAFYNVAIQAPLTEEVFFRGVILGGLLAHCTQSRAIFWSAFLFAVVHMNPWQFPGALILGLVFAWWVVQSGSLLPALFGHALNNFLAVTTARLELFGPMEDWDVVVYLPWWLFACGVILALIGLWWFSQIAKNRGEQVNTPPDRERV